MTLNVWFRFLLRDKRALTIIAIALSTVAQLACSPQPKPESKERPTIYSGPNRYHDLTELNYVNVWVRGLSMRVEPTCVLNDQAQPCRTFMRPTNFGLGKEPELYLPALPVGKNRIEFQDRKGAPLAVTEFEVCRRTLEIDFGVGPDGVLETPDDPVERVRTRTWKDNLADWEALNDGTDATARETLVHDWAFRTTDTVEKLNNAGQIIDREIRLFASHGIPISSETYTPAGDLAQYREFCNATDLTGMPSNRQYSDGACGGFVPSFAHSYAHPGSDQTWRTGDDRLLQIAEYYHITQKEPFRAASPESRWFFTRYLTPATDATLHDYLEWLPQATTTEEFHEPDPARPGLWLRTILTRTEPDSDTEQVGYRKYEYQCAP